MADDKKIRVSKSEAFNTETAVAAQEAKIERANRHAERRGVTQESISRADKAAREHDGFIETVKVS
jgi:hypothetical protein